ncbi:MAG: putative 4-mercaptohistidine N1-methyltransferase [Verrucomicrobiota bacterium]
MSASYESPSLLDQYLLFHYGTPEEIAPPPGTPEEALNFPVTTAQLAAGDEQSLTRTLDLGCAVGRSAFELAKSATEVLALDYSLSFIQTAANIRDQGSLPYRRHDEGHLYTDLVAQRPTDSHPDRITFEAGDAMALPPDLGQFDIVHAANLICRLSDPRKLLPRLPALVKPGGRLLLATPATWLEEFTPPKLWPKGTTLDYLKDHLAPHFELAQVEELPFLIREHARKFQFSTSQTSLWIRF